MPTTMRTVSHRLAQGQAAGGGGGFGGEEAGGGPVAAGGGGGGGVGGEAPPAEAAAGHAGAGGAGLDGGGHGLVGLGPGEPEPVAERVVGGGQQRADRRLVAGPEQVGGVEHAVLLVDHVLGRAS